MQLDDLHEEIKIELDLMSAIVNELLSLQKDVRERTPTIREKAATGAFLAQFYGGVENILKRICKYNNVSIPSGSTWHLDLFKMFCDPPTPPLPVLFNEKFKNRIAPFRKFRHVVHHGYGFQLEWERMSPGIEIIEQIFTEFSNSIGNYLPHLSQ